MESDIINMNPIVEEKRIESKLDIQTYLDRLRYALKSGSTKISFQRDRKVDQLREYRFTNRFTLGNIFPDEDEVEVLKRELALLTVEEYIETVKDRKFPNRTEMRVFGKQYSRDDVYIKIRVQLVNVTLAYGDSFILVMSFHYSERNFHESDFPYKKV